MSSHARGTLFVVGVLTAGLLLAALGRAFINGRDDVAPDVSDLVPHPVHVSDQENAHTYLTQAVALLQWPEGTRDIGSSPEEWDDSFVAGVLSRNGEALAFIERALTCPTYRAGSVSRLPSVGGLQWHQLVTFITQEAAYERRAGQTAAACASACDLLRMGYLLTSHPGSLNEWSSGLLALELGSAGIERLLHEAEVDEAELVSLFQRLDHGDVPAVGLAEAFRTEFHRVNQAIDQCVGRSRRSLAGGYAFNPNRTRHTAAQFYRAMIQNTSQPYARARLPEVAPVRIGGIHRFLFSLRPNQQGRMLYGLFLPPPSSLDRYLAKKCEIQSHLHGLRLVIACRLWQIRHGQLPQTLESLVPELLDAVPLDPFDGKPFRYSREGAVVYSVGKDLKDSWAAGEHPSDPLLTSDTAEAEETSDWPEYPSPERLLIRTVYEVGDLIYRIRAPAE